MKTVPVYTKVLTLGSSKTENALTGEVVLQEKIDGSQMGFGINEDNNLVIRSRTGQLCVEAPEKMFKEGVDYLVSVAVALKANFPADTYFYAEYLRKPKHNVLKYGRIPLNHFALFDVMKPNGEWERNRQKLEEYAGVLGIDVVPELYRGTATVDKIKELLAADSFLGNEKIEGIVIKNYNESFIVGGYCFPLFTKYVREEYKERHSAEWKCVKTNKQTIDLYIRSFRNENRWQKALLYLTEQGVIQNEPKDIGPLIDRVKQDIREEEAENIKTELYNRYIGDILRKSTAGLPEWYKKKLLENIASKSTEVNNERSI